MFLDNEIIPLMWYVRPGMQCHVLRVVSKCNDVVPKCNDVINKAHQAMYNMSFDVFNMSCTSALL